MFSEVFHRLPVFIVGLRNGLEEPHEISDCTCNRAGRRNVTDLLTAPFDDELLTTVMHAIKDVRKGAHGLGSRDVRFHII